MLCPIMLFQRSARGAAVFPRFSRSAAQAVPRHLAEHAATALAGIIAANRAEAIARGVRVVPPSISRALQGFFPEAMLRRCRFTVDSGSAIRLPTLRLTYGDAGFVTLGEVVSFTTEHAAQTDAGAWAHALTHVMQHQRWGPADFARRVVEDPAAIEREAAQNAARFVAWRNAQRAVGEA